MNNKQQTTASSIKTNQSLARLFKIIAKAVLIAISSLVIIVLFLLATKPGTRWLIGTTFSELEQVSVAEIDGTLVNKLTLKQLQFQDKNDFSVIIAEIQLQWTLSDIFKRHLHINKLQLSNISIKGQPAATEEAESESEIPSIPLNISIDQLIIDHANWDNGESNTKVNQLTINATLVDNNLTLSRLDLDMPELQVKASSRIKIQSDWPLSADLNWRYLINDNTVKGHLVVTGNMKRFDIISQIKGAIESNQSGFFSLSGDQPEFNLQAQWQKLKWPFTDTPQASSQRGEFAIQGTAQQYHTRLSADISVLNQADFAMNLIGNGNQHSINIEQLRLKPAKGQITVKGPLSWQHDIAFNLALAAEQINPSDFGADIPAKLNLNAHSKGSISDDKVNIALDIKQFEGVIHEQPVKAIGQVNITKQQLDIKKLDIIAGKNVLTAKGWLSEKKADLNLQIKAPDLKSAWPTLAGSLNGSALIKGSLNTPTVKSQLQGNNLKFSDNKIAKLSLLVDYIHASKKQSIVDFTAKNIKLADNQIKRIILHGQGNQSNHHAKLEVISALTNLDIKTHGQWDGHKWLATISELNIDHPQLHKWQLETASTLMLQQAKKDLIINLSHSCLTQSAAHLCIETKGSTETQLNSQLSLTAWSLANTKAWLPEEMNLTGDVSIQAQFSTGKKQTTAIVNATIPEGQALIMDEQQTHTIPFTESTVQINYAADQLESKIHLGLSSTDHISADIKADKANKKGVRQLTGSIKSNIANMTLIDGLVTEIDKLQGQFFSDMQLSGDTENPVVIGTIALQKGQFEIAKLGTTFSNIQFKLNSTKDKPEQLQLNASIESGKGKLSAIGELNLLPERDYPLNIKITGDNFLLSQLPEAEVVISPILTVDKQDKLTKINGQIKIDQATIKIQTIPENAVVISEDEIIITANETAKKIIDPPRLNTNIAIQFGDNTHFSGFGLDTHLTGKLQYITQQEHQRMLGRAIMKNASYRSYGQDLAIRKGEFVFTGPTDNPWLNIEAVRKANNEDITAVLAVTGLLKSPKTRIYTEPALSESEALAYLVTGKPMKTMTQSEGNSVANAAFSYGVGQLSWISDQLGIDEFELEQSDKIENSAIRLGQYLNPDLYVSVTMGLFANKYAANLRYRLTEHFSISTRAGETQRIDVKYHLQAD